jgi:hypothetical protein
LDPDSEGPADPDRDWEFGSGSWQAENGPKIGKNLEIIWLKSLTVLRTGVKKPYVTAFDQRKIPIINLLN